MSPVWTPAHPPPHPNSVSSYSQDAQIVLQALKAKYGFQLKKEEPSFYQDLSSFTYYPSDSEPRHEENQATVKQEPSTPRQETWPSMSHNFQDETLNERQLAPYSNNFSPGNCELLLTQTHTTEFISPDNQEEEVQFLWQEDTSYQDPGSDVQTKGPKRERQNSTPSLKLHDSRLPPYLDVSSQNFISSSTHCRDSSTIGGQDAYTWTSGDTGSPPIDLSPPHNNSSDFTFLAPYRPLQKNGHKSSKEKTSATVVRPIESSDNGAVNPTFYIGLLPFTQTGKNDMSLFAERSEDELLMGISSVQKSKDGCLNSNENSLESTEGRLLFEEDRNSCCSNDNEYERNEGPSSYLGFRSPQQESPLTITSSQRPDNSNPESSLKVRVQELRKSNKQAEQETSEGVKSTGRTLQSEEKGLDEIEQMLDKTIPHTPSNASSKRKSAVFKVPAKKNKRMESQRQTKLYKADSDNRLKHLHDTGHGCQDVTKPSKENLANLPSLVRCTSEIAMTLKYQNGGTQLREALTEKKRGSKTEERISGLIFACSDTEPGELYFVPFKSETLPLCRQLIMNVINSAARKICYCAQDCIRAVVHQFHLSPDDVVDKLVVMDPKVALWLTDSDNPPASFRDALVKCGMDHSESGSLSDDFRQLRSMMQLLYKRLSSEDQWPLFLKLEMKLLPILSLMELRGININTETLVKFGELLKKKTLKVEAEAHQCAGHQFLINSHAQLRQLLFEELKLDAKLPAKAKIARTSVNHQKSTSESVLNQLKEVHPLPGLILEYRQFQKLKSTYVDGMLVHVNDNYLHTSWDQTAAATGRLTSTNPNIQAIPKQPVELTGVVDNFIVGRESETVTIYMRDPFESEEGWSLLAADFQQIELRVLAHLADDSQLLHAFNDKECKDIFIELTRQWLGKGYKQITTSDREQTKRVVYSVMYGVGKERLADYLKMTSDNAKAIMQSFLVQFPGIKTFTNQAVETCRMKGYTQTIFKRRRLIPNIQHKSHVLRAQAERQAVNFCVQGSAADLCKAALVQVENALVQRPHLRSRLLIQIHDELLLEVPDEEIAEVKELVKTIMESSEGLCGNMTALKVPLRVSLSCGKRWGHMESI